MANKFMINALKMDLQSIECIKIINISETKTPSNYTIHVRVETMNMMHILNAHLKNIDGTYTLGQWVPEELRDVYLGLQTLGYIQCKKV